jgi:S-adenosylmethionine:tRNA ribosyltransferase-isomerase
MKAAHSPRHEKSLVRLLVAKDCDLVDSSISLLPDYLRSGDLLVVNDASTLPASLAGCDATGSPLEIRLVAQLDEHVWQAVVFGEGDWHERTEDRPAPPKLTEGTEIMFSEEFRARILKKNEISDRLLNIEFNSSGEDLWHGIYAYGKPVQYSYLNEELKPWELQNIYSSRPWAVEMPSAGHAIEWQLLLTLMKKGVRIATLTHGAGLSATGDVRIDRALPLPERFDIPSTTWEAIRTATGRVIAVGTSVVRALESAALGVTGITNLKIDAGHKLQAVDALLTGTHDVSESHYRLLRAFLPEPCLLKMSRFLEAQGYLTHEFGDLCLILPGECLGESLDISRW